MPIRLMALAICLLVYTAVRAQDLPIKSPDPKPEPSARVPLISGHVFRSDTGAPIAKAKVTLYTTVASSNGSYQSAETDEHGEFSFFSVRMTTYIPRATAEGFVAEEYSRDGTLEGEFLQLKPGMTFQNVDFHLAVGGAISGSVVDEHGAPVKNLEVNAVHIQFSPGGLEKIVSLQSTRTDAGGNFRLQGLLPDSYFIVANGPHGNSIPGNDYQETYYPEEFSAKSAKPVSVAAGNETKNIQISVKAEKRYTITGQIGGPGQAGDSERYRYTVGVNGRNHSYSMKDDGSFTIPDIPAGEYTLTAMAQNTETHRFVGLGTAKVRVADADTQVNIEVGGAGEVSGGALMPSSLQPLTGIRLVMFSDEAGNGSAFDENGRFTVSRVLPGRYFFELTKTDRPIYLKQIRCSGRDYTSEPITIAPQQIVSDCEAVLADDAGTIAGQIATGNRPASEFTAVVIPETLNLRQQPRYTITAKLGADGRFTIPNVIPGDYFLFVVPSSADQPYFALDFADRHKAEAQRVSVKPRQTQFINVKTTG